MRRETTKLEKYDGSTLYDILSIKDEVQAIKAENFEMAHIIESIQNELSIVTAGDLPVEVNSNSNFFIETKAGGSHYSTAIQKLY